jgi:hypothetical protein
VTRRKVSNELLRRGGKLDRYEVRELIGQGGMGEVYRAWDTVLQRDVAVKILTLREPEMLRRFEREAAAIGKLDNPNVVEIHDFRMIGEYPYIVMEYLRGENLVDRLKRGGMPVAEAVEVGLGVCRGVGACHRVGIIHRDVKPANVFLAETAYYGRVVKVLDFGVSKPVLVGEDLTGVGQVIGTPRYIAPEQLRGMEADELSDQYGIGLLTYCALSGRPPFKRRDKKELVQAILRAEYPRLREIRPDVPEGLEVVIHKAMSVDRAERFVSVMALGRALLASAPSEAQEVWRDHFTGDESSQQGVSGVTTKREGAGVEDGGRTAVMAREVLEELVAGEQQEKGDGVSARERLAAAVVVPVAPMASAPQPVAHMMSETHIDSSLVAARRPLVDRTHVGGVIETKPRSAEPRRIARRTVVAAIVAGMVLVLVGVAALLRGGSSRAVAVSREPVVPMVDRGESIDAGVPTVGGPPAVVVPPEEERAAVPDGGAARSARPKLRKATKWGKVAPGKLEYTEDGSPIIW